MLSAACRRALSSAATGAAAGKEAAVAATTAAARHAQEDPPLDILHLSRLAGLQPQPGYAEDAAALLAFVRVLEDAPTDTAGDAPRS